MNMGQINFESINFNWNRIKRIVSSKATSCGRNPDDVKIIAVSKTHPAQFIKWGIDAGIPIFGENYAQEAKEKYEDVSGLGCVQPEWHFIGHLQSNKVKFLVPFVSMIHSVDSFHLAEEISKQVAKLSKTMDILLQVNTSGELSKSGCEPDEIFELFETVSNLDNLRIKGLMTIGSFSPDEEIYRQEFRVLSGIRDELKSMYPESQVTDLSMGMSGDFETAIEEGATMVRVGSAIFGPRYYP